MEGVCITILFLILGVSFTLNAQESTYQLDKKIKINVEHHVLTATLNNS